MKSMREEVPNFSPLVIHKVPRKICECYYKDMARLSVQTAAVNKDAQSNKSYSLVSIWYTGAVMICMIIHYK